MDDAPQHGPLAPEQHLLRFRERGDPGSLGALFDATAPELFRVALSLTSDAASAEDALQETYLVALEEAERWDPSRRVMPWLVGILRLKVLEVRRRWTRAPDPRRVPVPVKPPEGGTTVEQFDDDARVHAELEALPEPYRAVALMRWRYGLEPAEIAHIRGEPPGTVRSLLSRALERLRGTLRGLPAILSIGRLPRGLGAIRRSVVHAASAGVLAGGTTAAAIGGVIVAKKAIVAGVAALLLAGGGWLALRPGKEDAPRRVADTSVASPALTGVAAPKTAARTGGAAPAAAMTARAAGVEREGRVVGRIVGPEGRPAGGGFAYALDVSAKEPVFLQRSPVTPEGTFVLSLPAGAGGAAGLDLDVEIGARVPGFALGAIRRRLAAGRDEHVEIRVEEGLALAGVVADRDGRPLAGLPVFAHSSGSADYVVGTWNLDNRRAMFGVDRAAYHEGRATTNGLGRFEIRGLRDGTYAVVSEAPQWFLKDERVHAPGEIDLRLLAVRGRSMRGTFTDAETGESIADGYLMIQLKTPGGSSSMTGAAARDGVFLAIWEQQPGFEETFEAVAEGHAKGYRTETASASYGSADTTKEISVALKPIHAAEKGTVVVEVRDSRGRPVDMRLVVDLRNAAEPSLDSSWAKTERVAGGRYRFQVPAGAWKATVHAPHATSGLVEGTADVFVASGQEVVARVELPPFGSVRLKFPGSKGPKWPPMALAVEPVEPRTDKLAGSVSDLQGGETEGLAPGDDCVLEAFPLGAWKLKLQFADKEIERTVVVREGEEALADFSE